MGSHSWKGQRWVEFQGLFGSGVHWCCSPSESGFLPSFCSAFQGSSFIPRLAPFMVPKWLQKFASAYHTMVLEKILESPLDCKEIQPVYPKGYQCWVFIGKTDDEAETPILWPPDVKSWLIGKDPDAGKDWGQEEKGMTENEMVGWHHQIDGHGFEWTPGVGEGQGGLACWGSWCCKESDTTELNWTELNHNVPGRRSFCR